MTEPRPHIALPVRCGDDGPHVIAVVGPDPDAPVRRVLDAQTGMPLTLDAWHFQHIVGGHPAASGWIQYAGATERTPIGTITFETEWGETMRGVPDA